MQQLNLNKQTFKFPTSLKTVVTAAAAAAAATFITELQITVGYRTIVDPNFSMSRKIPTLVHQGLYVYQLPS